MKTSIVCKLIALLVILAIVILSPLQAQTSEGQFQQGLIKEEEQVIMVEIPGPWPAQRREPGLPSLHRVP